MRDASALLAAAWTTGDLTPLLALADLFDEQADPDSAQLLRLTLADGQTARCDRIRQQQLRRLRTAAWERVRGTAWPDMAMQAGAAMSFSRRPNPARPNREHIVVRVERQTIHRLHSELDGQDEVIRTQDGEEVLRRRLSGDLLALIQRRCDLYWAAPFTLADDFFPIGLAQTDRKAAEAEQLRRFEGAVAPARMSAAELPAELVPFIAWLLAEHAADRPRRARGGEAVPGAHFFVFRNGAWRHGASLDSRDSGRAAELLRRRLRWESERGALAALLIRVADDGRITARKLVWIDTDGHDQETANLPGATATLPVSAFQQVVDELELDEAVFVLNSAEKFRALFGCG